MSKIYWWLSEPWGFFQKLESCDYIRVSRKIKLDFADILYFYVLVLTAKYGYWLGKQICSSKWINNLNWSPVVLPAGREEIMKTSLVVNLGVLNVGYLATCYCESFSSIGILLILVQNLHLQFIIISCTIRFPCKTLDIFFIQIPTSKILIALQKLLLNFENIWGILVIFDTLQKKSAFKPWGY